MAREVRLERLRPAELRAAMAEAPVAWVPLGALEFHAEHLPFGTDGFTAQGLVERAARAAGGVVLPWTALTIGTLHLEWSFRYEAAVVEAALRQTIAQLAGHGARVVVVHTGHAPLDLVHLIKRVCAEVEATIEGDGSFRAYGLCYLELNAALGAGLGTDWPVAVDHGSILESSWLLALEPELVRLERLPRSEGAVVGVYGPNPRDRASAGLGGSQLAACATLLAGRVAGLLRGERIDSMADLRVFVERYWPEDLVVTASPCGRDGAALRISNPWPVSRYLTSLGVRIDGRAVAPDQVRLRNDAPGEAGAVVRADELGPESGSYVRRAQSALVQLPGELAAGEHRVELDIGLAGVSTRTIDELVTFR